MHIEFFHVCCRCLGLRVFSSVQVILWQVDCFPPVIVEEGKPGIAAHTFVRDATNAAVVTVSAAVVTCLVCIGWYMLALG
jgi:hypothetical protein